jgi:cytochrome c5
MLRISTLLAVATLVVACSQAGDEQGPSTSPVVAPPPANDTVQLTGKQAYDLVCAQCHEEGVDDAPRTGDREAWANRSWLWEAVLFEHAKDGYMTMPAKGGDEMLNDATVEKAAEYMLTRTFPDLIPAN